MKFIIRGVGVEWRRARVLLSPVEQVLLQLRPTSASAVNTKASHDSQDSADSYTCN